MSDYKAAIVRVNDELFCSLFRFPEGMQITAVRRSPDRAQQWEIRVEGDALPDDCVLEPGWHLREVAPYYREEFHAVVPIEPGAQQTKISSVHFDGFH